MTENMIHKVGRIDQIVRDYFVDNKSINEVLAKDLMPQFIEKGIFNKDYKAAGLPIRSILRNLNAINKLQLLVHVKAVRKKVNTSWYFERI
ncbi:hypothetical protein [Mucilaginibacter sp. NFX135]|uniref:hypothetical protein n=1 Tax=Mucilaginibacter sp. NFX135 TaxID=3402687 RepID=UPI003AFB2BD7